ncbi:MAG: ATP-binding cassette domain-containing protein [Thermoanaerobaculia bacterium]
MIEVQNLSKRYPTRLAVDDVTFSVREGEIVGFLGPNGAGKTTTMRVLTGFLPPSSGTARVAGHDVVTQSKAARASLGYLPESAATYPEMRVREYLAFRARLEGVPGGLVRGRVQEALDRCLLAEVAGRKIENLSKGFRQRTALAGALVHQPPVLILDEPTIGLDPVQIIKIRETIRELGKNRSVLLSTHILPEVEAVCDRVLIIDRGRIVAEGTPSELRGKLAGSPVVRVAIRGAVAAREALAALPGVAAIEVEERADETRARLTCAPQGDPREDVFRLAVQKGWVLRELGREAMTLEDVFVRLTRHDEAAPAEAPAAPPADEPAAPAAESSSPAEGGEEPAS